MKRELLIASAVLGTFMSVASAAKADDDAGFTLACCRRSVPCPSATYVVPVSPSVHNEYNHFERNEINVYSRPSTPKTGPIFSRTPCPQLHLPPNGPDLTAGRTYTIKANYLCEKPGDVALFIGTTSHSCPIKSWAPNEVTFEVPNMGVAQPGTIAELRVTRPDGVVGLSRVVRLINPPDLIEHEESVSGSAGGQMGMYQGPVLNPAAGG